MQTVLGGLLYIICEVYVDDILVYGNTEEEFTENLKKVFQRFREYNLTIHPEKCFLGLLKVEYLGLLMDSEGFTFTENKKETLLAFPKPVTHKNMKSFLGMCNYFSTHVKNYVEMSAPLNQLITPYKPGNHITWTDEHSDTFERLKRAVHGCQKLYFLDPNEGEIHVKTDACVYGMGAYIYQILNAIEYPIRIV